MRRRDFTAVLAGPVFLWPPSVQSQGPTRVYRVGILGTVPVRTSGSTDPEALRIWNGFFDGLRELSYIEGQNIIIIGRFSEGNDERLPVLAAELVQLNVDVIVAAAHTPVAARSATSTIPIVMTNNGDPIERGLVASLARPAGNVTGLSTPNPHLVGKNLQLFKETIPSLTRVAILTNPAHPYRAQSLIEAEAAARALQLRLQVLDVRDASHLAAAFSAAASESADAVFVLGDPMLFGARSQIVGLAAGNHMPLMAPNREFSRAGCLMSYGWDTRDCFRRAANYVDKLFKGAKPADLPIELPTKFELVINQKTARVLGLTIPPAVLARADEVIE